MIHKHVRDLVCRVVVSAVKESKTGKERKSPGGVAKAAFLRRFRLHKGSEFKKHLREQHCAEGMTSAKAQWTGPVQCVAETAGREGRRGGMGHAIFSLFPSYLHCLLREAHHYGRQNQYYQCQWLRVVKPWVSFSTFQAHQAWLSDIIKDLFSLKSPKLPVNCIASIAFGWLPSFL